uniref:Uncharacterized protein n=1 Tax=viral metagenome TaxID=1070528 RepID=A0A6M3K546_9ZZZZ
MGNDKSRDSILESAIKQAIGNLAEKGVEGCTTNDVILASFGALSLNGGLATATEMKSLAVEVKKFGWKVVGACFSTLIAIIIVLIFL